jgi:type VI protein secretion system component VasK
MFFGTSKTATLTFIVRPTSLEPPANRFVLAFNNQRADITLPGLRATQLTVDWPGQGGSIVGTFEARAFPPESAAYQGAWGWFRMIENGTPTWPDSQHVTFNFPTAFNRAGMTIETASPITNPFTRDAVWRRFKCHP